MPMLRNGSGEMVAESRKKFRHPSAQPAIILVYNARQ